MKQGDRFYYENGQDTNTRFSLEQLNEIRKASMSRVLCDNLDLVSQIQKRAFEQTNSNGDNQMVKCSAFDKVDLSKWSNEPSSSSS
jgi:peroxidase